MKKLLFGVFLFFMAINFTLAKAYLTYDNSTELGLAANYLYYDETIEDADYYYTTSISNEYEGIIKKINKKDLKVEWTSSNDWGLYIGLEQDEDNLYALFVGTAEDFEEDYYVITISKSDGSYTTYSYIYLETEDIYDGEIYREGNNLYVLTRGVSDSDAYVTKGVFTIDIPSKTVTKVDDYKNVSKDVINNITDNPELYDNIWTSIYPEEYDDIFISNEYSATDAKYFVGEASKDGQITSFIIKTDKTGKFLWIKEAQDNFHYFDINGFNNKYIVVIGYQDSARLGSERNQDTVVSSLIVLDRDGNILETHDVAKDLDLERIDLTHVHKFNDRLVLQAFGKKDALKSYLIVYKIMRHNITTEVIGKGSITAPGDALYNDKVNVEIKPENGYVLQKVVVKSASGKEIEFKDNSFTMPDEDVKITATFTSLVDQATDNPKTGFISITAGMILILVLGSTYLIVKKNKLNKI